MSWCAGIKREVIFASYIFGPFGRGRTKLSIRHFRIKLPIKAVEMA